MPSSTSPEVRTFSPIVMECGESLNVPQPELSHQEESSPPPRSGITRDVDGRAIVTEDAMDVKETTDNLEDVARNATTPSTEDTSEATPPTLAEADDSTNVEPHTIEANPDGMDKANVDNDGMDQSPDGNPSDCVPLTRLPPRPRGRGRDAEEIFFHMVPKSHGGPDKKRAVFRVWPRRPDGKPVMPTEEPMGTLSPDGFPWGATLYDFYNVNTVPGDQFATSQMTGSALLQAMKALGEYDATKPEIEWALSEGTPSDECLARTNWLIIGVEAEAHRVALANRSIIDGSEETEPDCTLKKEDTNEIVSDDEADPDPASISPLPIPTTSPFHPSHYPKPWPFVPFENPVPILLQERIPSYLLPRTLYVHDPFDLLPACESCFYNTSWNSMPDVVRTYNLKLSKDPEKERQKAEELEEFKTRTLVVLRYKRTEEQIKNYEPEIEVPLPPYPRRMTSIEESHLYLSPVAKAGEGHHSIVYKAEWELPRDLFVRPKICPDCFKESADKEIQRMKDAGRWEKLLRAAGWGPTGFAGHRSTRTEMDEPSDPSSLGRDGEIIEREIICVVPPNASPSHILEMMDERNIWDSLMEKRDTNTTVLDLRVAKNSDEEDSVVAIIRIDSPFSYESQKTCTHSDAFLPSTCPLNTFPVPRTAKFTVIAKLSFEYDHHLQREANNYQQFPQHFFRHYDGYTLIDQLHAIVPVHAIVPQFYGYYIPQEAEKEISESYLSPILLLEHCGEPVDPEVLSLEDQEESVSIVLRFQRAGWLHESLFPRNFLVQKGRPTEFSLQRQARPELSFRLIDFGRSKRIETKRERRIEEIEAVEMFRKLDGRMSITPA